MNTNPRVDRIAADIVANRRQHIADLGDIVWYVSEEAEYQPINEVEHEAIVAAVAAQLGIEVTR